MELWKNKNVTFFVHTRGIFFSKKKYNFTVPLTLSQPTSETPYPAPPSRISGTLTHTHRMTKFGRNTHLGINLLYGLKINSYCLKMPEISLKGPSKVSNLKRRYLKNGNSDLKDSSTFKIVNLILYNL